MWASILEPNLNAVEMKKPQETNCASLFLNKLLIFGKEVNNHYFLLQFIIFAKPLVKTSRVSVRCKHDNFKISMLSKPSAYMKPVGTWGADLCVQESDFSLLPRSRKSGEWINLGCHGNSYSSVLRVDGWWWVMECVYISKVDHLMVWTFVKRN